MKHLLNATIAVSIFFGVLFLLTFADIYFHDNHISRIIGTFSVASVLTVGFFKLSPKLKSIRSKQQ